MPLTPQPPPELPAEGPVDLLVVGGASLDLLHFRGRSVRSAGGAGLYTALAARRAGARVTMVGPRPVPMPAELARAARLIDWRGPTVPPERLPSFEIAHLGDGRSELVAHHWRSESELVPEMLPAGPTPDWSYCIPLTEPERQLAFVRHLAARGRPVAYGTWEGAVLHHPGTVRRTLELVDAFFCNESEASGLFGSLAAARVAPGKLLFITFLRQLDHVGGYKEDPWRKKSALLAIILRQRPEAFLRQEAAEPVPPVVDYHVQRSCLRLGLVRVEDAELERRLGARELLPPADEAAVREACYEAMAELVPASGRAMGAVDWFFFQNRRRCPEMTTPDCANCPADPVCAHRLELFQPVWRTSFY